MAYTTLANIKLYLGIPSGTTVDDSLLTSFLSQATNFIDTYVGAKLEATTNTRYYTSTNIHNLHLTLDYPLLSVTTLTNGDGTTISASDYRLFPLNHPAKRWIAIKQSSSTSWNFTNIDDLITVVGSWGLYSTVPDEITHITNRLVAYLYRQKDNANDLDRTVSTISGLLLPSQLPSDVFSVLSKYRIT